MTKEIILEELQKDMALLKKEYGVISIGIFGSYAKDSQQENSDIDFFVEVNEPLANNYFGLWNYLENKFNKKIDLVRKGQHLREKFINTVEKEIVYA
jgi:predicted nucleotidyltransferase